MTDTNEVDINAINEALSGGFLLVEQTIRKWSGRTMDKDLSDEVASSKHARQGAIRAVKTLLAGADAELKEANSALDALRGFVYANTLPWSTNSGAARGPRLLPVARSLDFLQKYNARRHEAREAIEAFLAVYDQRRAEAIANLGDAAKESDYPDINTLRGKFGDSIDIRPVPAVTDFEKVHIPAPLAQTLGTRMAMRQMDAAKRAVDNVRHQLLENISNMADKLQRLLDEDKPKLYKSLVGNLEASAQLLRDTAIGLDRQDMVNFADKVIEKLTAHSVDFYKAAPAGDIQQTLQQAKELIATAHTEIEWF